MGESPARMPYILKDAKIATDTTSGVKAAWVETLMSHRKRSSMNRIAFVGNSVPRRCGIAAFTTSLCESISRQYRHVDALVVPVTDTEKGYDYPPRVCFELAEKEISSYRRAADFLSINDVGVVCLQHEFGIYGGDAGSHVLALLRGLRMPIVTTMHTLLREPNPDQRAVMAELVELTSQFVVMTGRGSDFLREIYGVSERRINLIPHGIPDVPFVDPNFYKDKFGVEGMNVLLTFGLVGPNKGIEHALCAMPKVIEKHPDTVYIVLGATHPNLVREQGESYRRGLERLVNDLNIQGKVIFENRFVSDEELVEYLGVADIYITPYPQKEQICSGTLAYAAGTGKALISTPYWHAEELLADGRGRFIEPKNPDSIAEAVIDLLDNPTKRHKLRKAAYLYGRRMVWSTVAEQYMETFEKAVVDRVLRSSPAVEPKISRHSASDLPALNLDHLRRLTDSTGLLQHAIYSVPNFAEGYATDDNARALILTGMLDNTLDGLDGELGVLERRYMSMIQYAYNPGNGRFRNFLSYDRFWLEEAGSEDSHGRALWAAGSVVARSSDRGLRQWAATLFEKALPALLEFTSPRSWAFTLLGIDLYLSRFAGDRIAGDARYRLAERLLRMYQANAVDDWPWFEDSLTYCNAVIPHALLVTGNDLDDNAMIDTSLLSLDWLAHVQRPENAYFVPIGCDGFYRKDATRARFDQQPIEAYSTISACLQALRYTGEERWRHETEVAFGWFLGNNDLGRPLYDPSTGGCYDGLEPDEVNRNQGAESMLAFLLARTEVQLAFGEEGSGGVKPPSHGSQSVASTVEAIP